MYVNVACLNKIKENKFYILHLWFYIIDKFDFPMSSSTSIWSFFKKFLKIYHERKSHCTEKKLICLAWRIVILEKSKQKNHWRLWHFPLREYILLFADVCYLLGYCFYLFLFLFLCNIYISHSCFNI